jgi:hypothetical protein
VRFICLLAFFFAPASCLLVAAVFGGVGRVIHAPERAQRQQAAKNAPVHSAASGKPRPRKSQKLDTHITTKPNNKTKQKNTTA